MTTHQRFSLAVALCASAAHCQAAVRSPGATSGPQARRATVTTSLCQVSEAGGGATWTYTITKTSDATRRTSVTSSSTSIPAAARVPRSPASSPPPSMAWTGGPASRRRKARPVATSRRRTSSSSTTCPKPTRYVIEFTLDDVYPLMDSTAWLKSGTVVREKALPGPGCRGYTRTTTMEADASLAGQPYADINTYMRRFGFDYTEHPNCTGGYGGHIDGVHGDVEADPISEAGTCSASTSTSIRSSTAIAAAPAPWTASATR